MSRSPAQTLRLLCQLRAAEVEGARGKLALANAEARDKQTDEVNAQDAFETLNASAETYVERHILNLAPTQDGASVYAALAFGAVQRRREAASAELQHRRATSRREEAATNAQAAAQIYLDARVRTQSLEKRRDEIAARDMRRVHEREDDAIAEVLAARATLGIMKD